MGICRSGIERDGEGPDPMVSRRIKKLVVESAHAKGIILINEAEKEKGEPFDSSVFPFKYPTATILPTVEVTKVKPTPVIASFSSRGPGGLTETILKAA
ncbi:hypothetical protein C5167_045137 [Papaver somniferum]|uniref:Uncharacterized protein n=1 Tax=Papaver somniferum TaxID=3469 RepID=A0A4Y7LDJ1_PAPSO|nr:hypothetical protein C5167_045137 [Papaver somniferum]